MKRTTILLLCAVLGTAGVRPPPVFNDTFEDDPLHVGVPRRYKVFGDEMRGGSITIDELGDGNHCAYVEIDFEKDTWGGLVLCNAGDLKLRGTEISVRVRAAVDMQAMDGVVGFKLIDADGTEFRTAEKDLFSPGTTWQTFSQKARKLVPCDIKGENPKLDLGHITHYGIAFYDRGDYNEQVTIFFDDFKAQKR